MAYEAAPTETYYDDMPSFYLDRAMVINGLASQGFGQRIVEGEDGILTLETFSY